MTDDDRLVELVKKRIAHLGLHSHLYDNAYMARELVRSLRIGDGVTITPPPKPELTFTISGLSKEQIAQIANGLHARYVTDEQWVSKGVNELFWRIVHLSPDNEEEVYRDR